jgi:hypothetical protein
MGFVLMLTLVLFPTVIGPAALAGVVCQVYGSAGYANGIRVHFVGKTPWFTTGERVPDVLHTASSLGACVLSVLLSYLLAYCVRHIYRLTQKRKDARV